MAHRSTFVCDNCEEQYMIVEDMDIPPRWFAVQIAIADSEGYVPVQERDIFVHFCSQRCAAEYMKSDTVRARAAMVDQKNDEEEDARD